MHVEFLYLPLSCSLTLVLYLAAAGVLPLLPSAPVLSPAPDTDTADVVASVLLSMALLALLALLPTGSVMGATPDTLLAWLPRDSVTYPLSRSHHRTLTHTDTGERRAE
jgi:hypothetical protein